MLQIIAIVPVKELKNQLIDCTRTPKTKIKIKTIKANAELITQYLDITITPRLFAHD
ncbi:MAG: hypothetical protein ACI936_003947 [Paraglaciecola sp.]|jgi:hypothetical protein